MRVCVRFEKMQRRNSDSTAHNPIQNNQQNLYLVGNQGFRWMVYQQL